MSPSDICDLVRGVGPRRYTDPGSNGHFQMFWFVPHVSGFWKMPLQMKGTENGDLILCRCRHRIFATWQEVLGLPRCTDPSVLAAPTGICRKLAASGCVSLSLSLTHSLTLTLLFSLSFFFSLSLALHPPLPLAFPLSLSLSLSHSSM